ncbi:amino acid adenylation domain-containing protein [Anaerosphaera multitolerans]|uniref:Amino acid adenylation domain-containing protein n=1 Tax=Anaerosphaera multitolerans TaxID=2487351 RepID=A0A437S737_9FIRM|nr:amino acid adenylation domain-containing protein [Anaerosphaera multitolerans]RVU54812.1 amino acid adenylation domain-containing protein [Anaerosphaera multitolerans]
MAINLVEYLERSAERFPDKLAISDEKLELTFSELRSYAKSIASYINSITSETNRPIAVEVDRCTQSIVMFLGVLYSGNFYVPIDNKMPKERVEVILNDIKPLLSLDIKENGFFAKFDGKRNNFDNIVNFKVNEEALKVRQDNLIDMDPCYMIYTSGSTGMPKGVVISHRMVMDFADFLSETFGINNEDVLANQAPFYFDCSVKCIYQMLRNGSTLYIMRPTYFMFPIKAIEFFNEKKITTLLWATSGLNILSSSGVFEKLKPETVNKVFFSGEMLYAKDYLLWKEACKEKAKFINLYGPTEVTVDCTYYEIERDFNKDEVIPIGKACRNMNVYLLNENDELAKGDEIGEICARGTGISYGYYDNREKTEEVFVQNPFNDKFRDIIYRTGDLARYNEFGELVYVSRKDNQVKHMGSRIELGEIEVAAVSVDLVSEAVVFYDDDNKKIILFCKSTVKENDILKILKEKLPKYMIPNEIYVLEEFPYNRNGKIDRVKLKVLYFEELSKK